MNSSNNFTTSKTLGSEPLLSTTNWSKTYAEEVESYLDTMDILLDDETYEEILRLEAVER